MTSKLDTLERVEVTSRAQWRNWLKKHHGRSTGIWLVTWKKAVLEKYIGYDAVVEEALSFGWIDSLPRKLDEQRSMLYLSPRKPKSVWSKVNKARVEGLIVKDRMTEAGLRVTGTSKDNGSWFALDEVEALVMPPDLTTALAKNKTARRHFDAFPPSARKHFLTWINNARTAGTRSDRVSGTVHMAAKNLRLGSK